MDKSSTSTAKDPGQAVESTEPSPKKSRLSEEARDPPKPPLTLEEEFKVLRDEYDEHRLDEMVEENQLTEAQRGLLRKPIPEDMTSSDIFLGNKHMELANLVNKVGFAINEQNRRIVGVVQPFGAGKTKTALMLSHRFVVLPIRWTTNQILVKKLVTEQDSLFEAINIGTATTGIVRAFSARCLRLLELMLLSVAAIFRECASESWFDARNEQHRLQFAILAISSGSVVVSKIANWFQENIETTTTARLFDVRRTEVLNEVRTMSGLRLVFVMDEVQKLFAEKNGAVCQGYVLHTAVTSNTVANWKKEVIDHETTRRRCTDLFHQLGCVMLDWLGVEAAFVMCSTLFSTWTTIEDMGSPLSRGVLRRFTDTHWLSEHDIKRLVQYYFAVPDDQLDVLDLKLLTRPVFANDFVLRLHSNVGMLNSMTMVGWLEQSYKKTVRQSLKRLREAAVVARQESKTRKAMYNLITCIRVCAGILERDHDDDESEDFSQDEAEEEEEEEEEGAEDEEEEAEAEEEEEEDDDDDEEGDSDGEVELVNVGLLKLEGTDDDPDQVEIADPLAERAVLRCFKKTEVNVVLKTLARDLRTFSVQDESHKGFVFEQVLAYLALRGLIRVPKYAANGTVTHECVMSTAKFAGHFKQLKLKIESLTDASEPSFVCDLLSGRQLPEYVYLPTKSCKPDVLFRGNKMIGDQRGGFVNVVIQSKVIDKVLDYSGFLEALSSLDPAKMYGDSKEKQLMWQQRRGTLREWQYMRIVFAAAGFNAEVQHIVHEYNLQQARSATPTNIPSFIHLLNLDDLRNALGKTLYRKVKKRIPTAVRKNLVVHNDMPIYESAWKHTAQTMDKPALVKLCSDWGILRDKTKNTEKSEAELREELVNHETELAKCLRELAVSLHVDACSAQPTNE